jgi:hypothetical protein
MRIDGPLSVGELYAPDVLARLDTMHAHLSRFGTAWITHPHNAKARFLLPMLYANDVAFLARVLDSGDASARRRNVDGPRLARKWSSDAVHSPNADGELSRRPVINTASHCGQENYE